MRACLLALAVACRSSPPPAPPAAATASDVQVDRRIELVSIAWRLAGAHAYSMAAATPYRDDVDRAFGALADDPAIAAAKQLRERGIDYDAPIDLAIHLDDHFALRAPPSDARWTGIDTRELADKLHAFAERGKLDDFFAAHRAYYAAVERRFHDAVTRENPVPWFDTFFGARPGAQYVVVPGLLEGPHNFGVHDGARMYQVLGVDVPDTEGLPTISEQTLELLVHEMAHSYVNPILAAHRGELEAAGNAVFAFVEPKMRDQAYTTWDVMMNEAVVRAVTVLYVRARKSPEAAAAALRDEVRRGFAWTGELADLLALHHMDVAAIAAEFRELAARYQREGIPFSGPINAALVEPAFVLPTDPDLARYATQIHDRFFPHAPLGDKLPASGNAVLYGAKLAHAGLEIASDHVAIAGKTFAGEHLAVIAAWPRDEDPRSGVVYYTAATAADLVGINSLRHGPTDWLVARKTPGGFELVASGDFAAAR